MKTKICNIKEKIPDEFMVIFKEVKYQPKGYLLSFDSNGNPLHTVLLINPDTNYLVYADLRDVFFCKKGE